ncbi:hypothetical protein V5N11_008710 [Cardamine amara subsp. amara]|uniref:Uncharacterized protein n=1 Tax=Cardamine amara subsp. amara TaxID=228776 RepID=A0ABD1BUB1_CARAN
MGVSFLHIKPYEQRLTTFDSRSIKAAGMIKHPVQASNVKKMVKFVVVDEPVVYNVIMGTRWHHEMRAVSSSYHQCLCFPSGREVFTIRGS